MKLYGNTMGSNCRRVTIYLAEKGLNIDMVVVDVAAGEHKTAQFRARNPAGLIPVLELDDGSYIPESSAIVEYLGVWGALRSRAALGDAVKFRAVMSRVPDVEPDPDDIRQHLEVDGEPLEGGAARSKR